MRGFLNKQLYTVIFVAGCSLLFLAVSGYRPYPSIDDFAYIPFLMKTITPSLFNGDLALEGVIAQKHLLFLGNLPFFEQALPSLYFLLTGILAVGTGTLALLFLRHFGGSGNLLPLLLYGTSGTILIGIGRGSFDGLFGHGFHPQWGGLFLALLAYFLLLRNYNKSCGVVLAAIFYTHHIIAIHTFFIILVALIIRSILQKRFLGFEYISILGIPILLGFPSVLNIWAHFSRVISLSSSLPVTIYQDIFLFRYPHEFYEILTWNQYFIGALLLFVVVAAMITIYPKLKNELAVLLGLIIGHSILLSCYVLSTRAFTGSLPWWVHLIHFSRTTPLLVFLLNLIVVAAIENSFPRVQKPDSQNSGSKVESIELTGFILLVSYGLLCLFGGQVNKVFLFLPLMLLLYPLIGQKMEPKLLNKVFIGILLVAALTGLAFQPLQASVEKEEEQLFTWCRDRTDKDSLFIVPPTFYTFRLYAKRPIYSSFRPFLLKFPHAAYELKERLVMICNPDKNAFERSWYDVDQWERSYLRRNPPDRIALLLNETKSSYWVVDHQAQMIPPFYPVISHEKTQKLKIAFQNARFTVYSLNSDNPL